MTPPLSNHPQSPPNPVEGEMRLLLECFNQWLEDSGTRTQKAHRILEALASESLKLAEKDRAARQFEVEYLTDAMGEFPWRFSKDRNEWLAWNKTVIPYITSRESSLIAFAKSKGLKKYPYPVKHATTGGPGNKATYEIIGIDIDDLVPSEMPNIFRGTLVSKPTHPASGSPLHSLSASYKWLIGQRVRASIVLLVILPLITGLAFIKNPQAQSAKDLLGDSGVSPASPPLSIDQSNNGFVCGTKRTCKEMASCAEAQFYLKTCGLMSLDRDHDGIGCENLCR